MAIEHVTGVVLAAGLSRRLGTPKQLLPYGDTTLLGATLDVARACAFDQLIVTIGAGLPPLGTVLDGTQPVVVPVGATGCSSSLRAALSVVDARAAGLVLLLGDQPTVAPTTVADLLSGRGDAALAVCRYRDGIGHPFWLGRARFGELEGLHGDKAVWKLVDRGPVREVPIDADVPPDVDTWDDYRRLLAVAS